MTVLIMINSLKIYYLKYHKFCYKVYFSIEFLKQKYVSIPKASKNEKLCK